MKKSIIGLIVLTLILIIAMNVFRRPIPVIDIPDNNDFVPASTTMQGTFVCLPHRDTSGPQTMECAFGLKADSGKYYALDWSGTPTSAFDLPMDRKFSVSGTLVPIEAISSDQWQKYDVEGIIRVSSHAELSSGIPTMPLGKVTLELNKPVMIAGTGTTLKIGTVLEDSRCPSDVTCIQAGRVRIMVSVVTPSGSSATELEIGKTMTTETLSIVFDDASHHPVSTRKITDGEYRFLLTISKL